MPDTNPITREVIQAIDRANHIMITAHIRPDGDAVGSVLGLGLSLKLLGKTVQMVIQDGVPRVFQYFSGWQDIQRSANEGYDLSIVLDCSDMQRTGNVMPGSMPDINIDHHITNLNFAKINLVRPEAAATAQIVTDLVMEGGYPITLEIAQALLSGIIIDTIGFRTSNVTPQTLRTAAVLMEFGVNLPDLYYKGIIQRSYEAAAYWGKGLNKIQHDGNIVWTSLTLTDRAETGYSGNDDADLVNMLSTIEPYPIAILFTEQSPEKTKVSWRSHPGWDVSELALRYNGGGHPAAAGAEISGNLADVTTQVLAATTQFFQSKIKEQESLVGEQQGGK